MRELLQVQPIFVCFSYTIARLHYNYGCPTLNAAYVCQLYLQNHWVALSLMGARLSVRLTLITSTKRITWLHYSYGCATFSRAYAAYLYFLKDWVIPQK